MAGGGRVTLCNKWTPHRFHFFYRNPSVLAILAGSTKTAATNARLDHDDDAEVRIKRQTADYNNDHEAADEDDDDDDGDDDDDDVDDDDHDDDEFMML